MDTKQTNRPAIDTATPEWLREAATRHERSGQPVWAMLYRNDALRMEAKQMEDIRIAVAV